MYIINRYIEIRPDGVLVLKDQIRPSQFKRAYLILNDLPPPRSLLVASIEADRERTHDSNHEDMRPTNNNPNQQPSFSGLVSRKPTR
jgi:hypothetical protein